MVAPVTAKFGKFRVLLDPAGTGTYTAPCGFTSKSLNLSKDLSDILLPDCDNPDEVAWVGRDAISRSGAVSGEGVLAASSVETWLDAYDDDDSVAVKIEIEFTTKTITWTGRFHIESFEASASQGERCLANVSLQSDGALVRTVS